MNSKIPINEKDLPLLLKNMKKVFGKNIQGPFKHATREYQMTTIIKYLKDTINFLFNRGVKRLAAMHVWEDKEEKKLAYHFIAKIGDENYDSKISIIINLVENELNIPSIKKMYHNALIYEEEINKSYKINFVEK